MASTPQATRPSLLSLVPRSTAARTLMCLSMVLLLIVYFWMTALRKDALVPDWEPIFIRLFLFQDFYAVVVSILVVILAFTGAAQHAGAALASVMARNPGRVSIVLGVCFAAGALFVYHNHPLAMDEYAPYLQSQVFASGHLAGQLPTAYLDWLVPEGFQGQFLRVNVQTGAVASSYLPGFALLLTPFTALGVPWLCNAIIGALTLWVIYRIALELFSSEEAAGYAMLFTVASAAVAVNAMSYYSMAAHLLCSGLYCLALLRPSKQRAFAAGVVGSLALLLHNPLPHVLFALPWVVWLALRRDRLALLACLALGYLPLLLVAGLGWMLATAAVFSDPAANQHPAALDLQALTSVFKIPTVSVVLVRLMGLAKLLLWSVPIVCLLALVGAWRWRREPRLLLLSLSAVLTFVGYLFVPFDQGHGWGFRYFHSAWLWVPLLATAALFGSGDEATTGDAETRSELRRLSASCAILSLVLLMALRLFQVHDFIGAHLRQLPTTSEGSAKVVIVTLSTGYYKGDLVQNDPFLRRRPIIMITRGRKHDLAMLRQNFPDLVLLHREPQGEVWGVKPSSTPP